MGQCLFSLRHLPSFPHVPRLQFQVGIQAASPSGKGGVLPQASMPPLGWAAGVEGLIELFGTPTPLPGPLSMPEPQVQKRGTVQSSGGSV